MDAQSVVLKSRQLSRLDRAVSIIARAARAVGVRSSGKILHEYSNSAIARMARKHDKMDWPSSSARICGKLNLEAEQLAGYLMSTSIFRELHAKRSWHRNSDGSARGTFLQITVCSGHPMVFGSD